MKPRNLKNIPENDLGNKDFKEEDFTAIHSMAEDLLISLKSKKQTKIKRPRPLKKWANEKKKKAQMEDLNIRELPFTF